MLAAVEVEQAALTASEAPGVLDLEGLTRTTLAAAAEVTEGVLLAAMALLVLVVLEEITLAALAAVLEELQFLQTVLLAL